MKTLKLLIGRKPMIYYILLILGLLAFSGEIGIIIVWLIGYIRFKDLKTTDYAPKVSIIVPCKGTRENFDENILSICNQDYKDFNIIFVTDSKIDPAYIKLKELVGKNKKVKIVISEFIKGSSGKISALIKGVKNSGETEVYVFADSDIKTNRSWLKNIVSPLKDEKIGASTGYRWYFPNNFQSLLLSVWNMFETVAMFFQISIYTWGGSTAIRKEIFDKLDIIKKWEKGFSDDLILTDSLRKEKYEIKFVPKCISESPPEGDLKYIIKWGTQQLTWVKWYYKTWWYLSVIGMIGLNTLTVLGFILIALGFYLPGLLMISTIFIEMIIGFVGYSVLKNLMVFEKSRYKSSIFYALLLPVNIFILTYNNIASIFKNEIVWGGRVYRKQDISN